jgi:hypothetical protein
VWSPTSSAPKWAQSLIHLSFGFHDDWITRCGVVTDHNHA